MAQLTKHPSVETLLFDERGHSEERVAQCDVYMHSLWAGLGRLYGVVCVRAFGGPSRRISGKCSHPNKVSNQGYNGIQIQLAVRSQNVDPLGNQVGLIYAS